jgi:hypothetical protein
LRRALVLLAAILLIFPLAARGESVTCSCATARETNGWCAVHELGYVAGVKVTSRWLYETIDAHGHQLDLSTFACPSCRTAIATDGFCDIHRVGFVEKQAYYSLLTYELGKAEVRPDGSITCPTCRKNAATHGWCAKSGVGMIGPFAIRDRHEYDRAAAALDVFLIANREAARCNYCAGAIITDGECPICRIRYKDGKPVRSGS